MVGAGPTGLVLAIELALRGIDVEVVERLTEPSGQSRGGGVNPRTCEVLAQRGLLDALAARAVKREEAGGHFAGLPVRLDTRPWRTRHDGGLLVPQDRAEAVFEERLRELGTVVRRGTEVVAVAPDADGVTATFVGPDGELELRGRYLVACDGGHSAVRKLLGVDFPGRAGTMSAVTADVELAAASSTVPRTVRHISEHIRAGGDYWMMMHPLGEAPGSVGLFRVVFGGAAQEGIPRDRPVTVAEVEAALTAVHGPETRIAKLRWGTRFSDATRLLEEYRHGPVLFAGDAAHIHPPMGGQGFNLGVQDAMNLGWKLAGHLRGQSIDLVDSYGSERRPVAAGVIALARAQSVLMGPSDPTALAGTDSNVGELRDVFVEMARLPDANRYLTGRMTGLDLRYDLGDPHPLVGARMPDLSLATVDGETTVSALLQSGAGLLLEIGDFPGVSEPVADGVDAVVARVLDSPIGTELAAARVLIRPDGYVCWAGDGAEAGLDAALRRWFGVETRALQGSLNV